MNNVSLKIIISKVIITWTGFLENDENDGALIKVLIFHRLSTSQRWIWNGYYNVPIHTWLGWWGMLFLLWTWYMKKWTPLWMRDQNRFGSVLQLFNGYECVGYWDIIFLVGMMCSSGGSNVLLWCDSSGTWKRIRRLLSVNTNYLKSY